jgi:hypothetical protein
MAFVDGEGFLRHMLIVFGYFETYSFANGETSASAKPSLRMRPGTCKGI